MSSNHLILGTAGHIDHGKTSLIRALTGVDTDRLPEEKKRGITIELGYANLTLDQFEFGIVDVPGHEKFVRQMLAGATGMDIAMLVIAADDSIKPQTVEHLDILRMLNLQHGLVAITKCDMVDPDWLDLVEDEIRGFLSDSFLAKATIVRTSSATGLGIEQLKTELKAEAQQVIEQRQDSANSSPFRMAIDRTFTIAGHGTVVTGSVSSGTISTGDQLEIQPGNHEVRVRGIQNHDHSVESIARGQRGAINLAGVHHTEISRGKELAAKGLLNASRSMILDVQMLDDLKRPLLDRQRIRFHVGTAEISGFVRTLSEQDGAIRKTIEPGESGIVQIFLSEPAVTVWNQPFVIRSESPVQTIAGGRVIHPFAPRINRKNKVQLEAAHLLTDNDSSTRVSSLIYLSPVAQWNPNDLAASAGVTDVQAILENLISLGDLIEIDLSSHRKIHVHRKHIDELGTTIEQKLTRFHDENPLAAGLGRKQIGAGFQYIPHTEIVNLAIDTVVKKGTVEKRQILLGLKGRGPQLSKNEQTLLASLLQQFEASGIQSPTLADLQKTVKKNKDSIPQLLELAVGRGDLHQVDSGYLIHRTTLNQIQTQVRELIKSQDGATMSEIRQKLDASRKYAVPLCEYLDKIKFTRRDGDKRYLADESEIS